jgi:8-oxo-dGTP pyrophosphatase MutT (NUDIX family)
MATTARYTVSGMTCGPLTEAAVREAVEEAGYRLVDGRAS